MVALTRRGAAWGVLCAAMFALATPVETARATEPDILVIGKSGDPDLLDPAVTLYVTLQILCEFYSVETNPKRIAAAFTAAEATKMLADLLELPGLHVLATPSLAARKLTELLSVLSH